MKNNFPIFIFVGVVAVISAFYFVWVQHAQIIIPQGSMSHNVDSEVKEIADHFMIGLVGEQEFHQNYSLNGDRSDNCQDDDSEIGSCYLIYRFGPGSAYSAMEHLLFYAYYDNSIKIANNDVPVELPSCQKDRNNCSFKLTLAQLQEIARENNLDDQRVELVMFEDQVVAELSYCNFDTGENRRKIYVDLQDGSVLWEGQNRECQGIN